MVTYPTIVPMPGMRISKLAASSPFHRRPFLSESLGLEMAASLQDAASPEESTVIQTAIDQLLRSLAGQMDVVEQEAHYATDPDKKSLIPDVGPYFTSGQLLSQVIADAQAVTAVAFKLQASAAGTYLTPFQVSQIDGLYRRTQGLINTIPADLTEAITGEDERLSEFHTSHHVGDAQDAELAIERQVVSAEAPSVAVREPSEKEFTQFLGYGMLTAAGVAIFLLLS